MKKIISLIIVATMLLLSLSISFAEKKKDTMTEEEFEQQIELVNQQVQKMHESFIFGTDNNLNDVDVQSTDPGGGSPIAVKPGVNATFTTLTLIDYNKITSGSGAYAKAAGSLSAKKLYLRADADPLYSNATAYGTLGRDFWFDSTSNRFAYVAFAGNVVGELYGYNSSLGSISIVGKIYDVTDGTLVTSTALYSNSVDSVLDAKSINSNFSKKAGITLQAGHRYKAVIEVDVSAQARAISGAYSQFHNDRNGYVKLDSIAITF